MIFQQIQNSFFWTNKKYIILIFLLIYAVGYISSLEIQNKGLLSQLEINKKQLEDYTSIKNQNEYLTTKNKEYKKELDYFKSKKQEVKYITKTEVKLVGKQEEFKELKKDYTFKLNEKIPVARFEQLNDKYKYTTYDLKYKATTIIGEKESLTKLTITSSESNEEYQIPIENSVTIENTNTENNRLFAPNIMLGAAINSKPALEGIIGVSLLESKQERFRYIMPTISFSNTDLNVGLTPFQYNLGKPLPLVNNLWIGIGYESDIINHYVNLNITSKL